MFYERERFTLKTDTETFVVPSDPIGWDEVETTLARSENTLGIFTEVKQGLEFVKESKEWLQLQEIKGGSETSPSLLREYLVDSKWMLRNEGFLDFSTAKWDKTTFNADYVESNFSELFKNNIREKYELDRTESLDRLPLPELTKRNLYLPGKKIFLQSKLENQDLNNSDIDTLNQVNGFNVGYSATPFVQVYQSDEAVSGFVSNIGFGFNNNSGLSTFATASNFFYQSSPIPRTLTVEIDADARISSFDGSDFNNGGDLTYAIEKWSFNGTNYERIEIVQTIYTVQGNNVVLDSVISLDTSIEIDLLEDELLFAGWRFAGQQNISPASLVAIIDYDHAILEVKEENYYQPTNTDCLTAFDVGQRLVKIINPDAEFESSFLTEEEPNILLASGETVRNILYNDEKAPILSTSFEEFYKFLYTFNPVGYDVILKDGRPTVILEKLDWFFNQNKTIKALGVYDVRYEVDPSLLYSSVKIGYTKSGDNEEVYGLQITSTENTFKTPINSVENVYDATNNYIADTNEKELVRRKQYADAPDLDNQHDKNVLVFDGATSDPNRINFSLRPFSQDFSQVSGIFDAESGDSYRFSPLNCLLRHGKVLTAGMKAQGFLGKEILFASTKGNTELSTTLIDGTVYQEDSNIPLTAFENPLFTAKKILFNGILTDILFEDLTGLDDCKRNAYSIIEFNDEKGNRAFGFIQRVDLNDDINFELKQAYGF